MGFKDLLILKEKENRLYLILILWLLIGYTMFQFEVLKVLGYILLIPLVILSFILFLTSLFSHKKKLREMSLKRVIISIIIAIPFLILFYTIVLVIFLLAVISYILITSIFIMHYFYEIGVKVDDYLYKLPGSIKNFERKGFFFGGIIISIILLISASIIIEVVTGGTRENVGFNTTVVAIFIIIIIVILGLIGIFLSKRGKINAWMGVFFVGVASYSIYLMISIVYTITSDGNSTSTSIPLGIALYFINFLILLNVIGGLIGTKTTVLKQKLRIFSTDTILMWLIFSVTSYEFASLGLENIEVELFRYIVVYVLFIPFLFILGLYGIIHYNKIMGKRKMQQLEIEAKKEGVIEINQVICKQCGAVNQKEAHYCTSCGKELK